MSINLTSVSDLNSVTGWVLFAADWCQPCKRLKPHIIDYIDYVYDVGDQVPADIQGVPTIRYYEFGVVEDEIVAPSPAAFRQWRGV